MSGSSINSLLALALRGNKGAAVILLGGPTIPYPTAMSASFSMDAYERTISRLEEVAYT